MLKSDYLIVGFFLGIFLFYWIVRLSDTIKRKRTWHRAKTAEKQAMEILESQGYRIIEIQPKKDIYYYLNGQERKAYVKADFLVRKYFRKIVCEVKSGEQSRITQAFVRRQVFDYYFAYGVKEVLLIDMERKKIDKISLKK